LLGAEEAFDRLVGGLARQQHDPERLDDFGGDVLRSPNGLEPHKPRAIREVGLDQARDLEREPCLADAAGTGEREQPN
jgi:hypothetical protein